ncbi:hypothetical protein CYLTODRAFT_402264 [Cylindrobasidium torrendii FP15055 ss-10]|uniref:UPF3 domain-containing protein n=1 Tax=Cylindrobasidium torrendii FP15055 ss-10 TaxID=1314674 RepID=A0A0D7B3P2_9AGAR|nr:hypothetical protein CYLTODRAFT_402264 [Cylindrobasidium torrendii FP15055 ss-10]
MASLGVSRGIPKQKRRGGGPQPSNSGGGAPTPRLKIVVRRLPANLPESIFWDSVTEWVTDDTVTWRSFRPGKSKARIGKETIQARAYIAFRDESLLVKFATAYNGHVFRDKSGTETAAVVEFAPFQKIPGGDGKKKKDGRVGTIESDDDYISFVETLNKPTEPVPIDQLITSSQQPPQPKSTPLLEALKAEREAKLMKVKERELAISAIEQAPKRGDSKKEKEREKKDAKGKGAQKKGGPSQAAPTQPPAKGSKGRGGKQAPQLPSAPPVQVQIQSKPQSTPVATAESSPQSGPSQATSPAAGPSRRGRPIIGLANRQFEAAMSGALKRPPRPSPQEPPTSKEKEKERTPSAIESQSGPSPKVTGILRRAPEGVPTIARTSAQPSHSSQPSISGQSDSGADPGDKDDEQGGRSPTKKRTRRGPRGTKEARAIKALKKAATEA